MSKKNDAAYDAFLADLKAINPAVEELIKDEKVSAKLRESVLARSEFSSQMDSLQAQRQEFEAYQAQERQKIEGWQNWYGTASTQVADVVNKLNKYREAYGDLTDTEQTREAAKLGLTKDELESKLNERFQQHDVAAIKFADDLTDLKIEHRDRFKEKLDTAKVYEIAGKQNIPLNLAYNIFIQDRVETQRKSEQETALKAAREEGAAEALAKHNLPMLSSASEHVHFLDNKAPLTNTSERVAAAAADFMKSQRR